jgi:methylmalonyl-CoA/ethylmalonyl-CoA epimerase
MIKKMRHLGVIVKDFDESVKKFKGFGFNCTEIQEREEDGLKIAFFPIGDTLIEFLHFREDKGWDPMHTVVRSIPGALNHLCLEVDDLDASIRDFEKNGAKLLEGCPRPGAHGRVAFFHPDTTDGVLIELCEV